MEPILESLTQKEILDQLAEEAVELAHAALKLGRAISGNNPTPLSVEECRANLIEEFADVQNVRNIVITSDEEYEEIQSIATKKMKRLRERIMSKKITSQGAEAGTKSAFLSPIDDKKKKVVGVSGFVKLRCACCGNEFGTFIQSPQASIPCRCGNTVELDRMANFEYNCPDCGRRGFGKTNILDVSIEVNCKCKKPVRLEWDRHKQKYTL